MRFIQAKKILFLYLFFVFAIIFFFHSTISAMATTTIHINNLKSLKTTKTLDGYNIPINPSTGQRGIGTVCIEMHLATHRQNPWDTKKYLELNSLPENYKTINYMTGPNSHKISFNQWSQRANKTSTFPGGAFGYMTAEEEMWYINMRWEYVNWIIENNSTRAINLNTDSLKWHIGHRKVLVTNLTTGLQAVAYIGDSGPGLNLGNPENNRIGGLSPDLMFYLSNQQGIKNIPTTVLGKDDETLYSFEWVINQKTPLGPVNIGKKTQINNELLLLAENSKVDTLFTPKQLLEDSVNMTLVNDGNIIPKDLGNGYIRINFDAAPFVVQEWSQNTPAKLTKGNLYPVVVNKGNWFKFFMPENNIEVWILAPYVSILPSAK